ncbi:MAG: hypothetical protein M5R40_10280 [Anaerolineae bacterium]|nr:hypothetical protein [Anaerolineae bacterium]
MYAGRLLEVGPVQETFAAPQHPYTQLLMNSLPSLEGKGTLQGVSGAPPSLLNPPSGCVFHPRCPYVWDRCKVEVPILRTTGAEQRAACHLLDEPQRVFEKEAQ